MNSFISSITKKKSPIKSYDETIRNADLIFNNSIKELKKLKPTSNYKLVDEINEEVLKSISELEGLYVSNAVYTKKQKNEFENSLRKYYDRYKKNSMIALKMKQDEDLRIKKIVDEMSIQRNIRNRNNERKKTELYNRLNKLEVPDKNPKSKSRKPKKYRKRFSKRVKFMN